MTNPTTPVANLRAARKEQAKQRHPAGKAAAPKPAAKKAAPAKAGAAAPKLKWRLEEERSEGNRAVEQTGVVGDAEYQIRRSGEKWKVLLKRGSQTETLADGVSYAQSYRIAVDHARKAAA